MEAIATVKASLRKAAPRRERVDDALDVLRYRIDSGRRLDYQPLPWLGATKANRDEGVYSRWTAMRGVIDDCGVTSAVDIGCNAGFFSLSLAEAGVSTIGVEGDPKFARLFLHAIRKVGVVNVAALVMNITPSNIEMLPSGDAVLLLSVWHHFVRYYGLEAATEMLRVVWAHTQKVLFFETGETEMSAKFGLPEMGPDPRSFVAALLTTNCNDGSVRHLGEHDAFAPDGSRCVRNLFAVVRA
jgi:hypothetical protein